jgi:glycerol-3-phosphate cytidylyltransferase-like family protein
MNQERFNLIFGKFAPKYDLKELFKYSSMGLMAFIEHAPDDMIDTMLSYGHTLNIAYGNLNTYEFTKHPYWIKFIYELGNEVITKEINLTDYEGNKAICEIYENANKILAVCRFCDEIDVPYNQRNSDSKRIKVYEGDIFSVSDDWKGKHSVILAAIQKHQITNDSIYFELLYTEKYAYLKPDGEPNEDEEPIRFKESIFNITDKKYNSHIITFANHYKLIGNLATHYDLLKPMGFKKKVKKTKKIG